MSKAQAIFEKAFSGPRDPRRPEYKAGVLAALEYRCREREKIENPYTPGTCQFDAYHAGIEEGHSLWKSQKYNEVYPFITLCKECNKRYRAGERLEWSDRIVLEKYVRRQKDYQACDGCGFDAFSGRYLWQGEKI